MNYQRLDDPEHQSRCCLPLRWFRKQKTREALNRDSLYTYDRLNNRAMELDMLCHGVQFQMTELTLEAKQHLEKHQDRERATSCLQQRHSLKKQYKNLVRMYTNAKLLANKLTEAAMYQRFSLALLESNQSLDHILSHLDYETIETMLDQVQDQHYQIDEIGTLLSSEAVSDEHTRLDVEREIQQLMEQETLLQTSELPSIAVISGTEVEKKRATLLKN